MNIVCLKIEAKINLSQEMENYEIIAITNGGIIPATIISYKTGIKNINLFPVVNKRIIKNRIPKFSLNKKYLLIDEIYDTGKTLNMVKEYFTFIDHLDVFVIERYRHESIENHIYGHLLNDPRWIVFPWENHNANNRI